MKSILLFTLILCLGTVLQAQEWKLIYENDKDGNAVTGELEDLIQAVRDGQSIRIAWWAQHPTRSEIKVEHLTDASFMTIMGDSIVFTQIRPITGQVPDFTTSKITLKENLEWVFIGGTNGKMDYITRNTISGEIIDHGESQRPFKWYIQK